MTYRLQIFVTITILGTLSLACGPSFLARSLPTPTATPTKTPSPLPTNVPDPALATDTPTPLPPSTATPIPPTSTPAPEEPTPTEEPTATPEPEVPTPTAEPTDTPAPEEPAPTEEPAAASEPTAIETEAEPAPPPTEEPAPAEDVAFKIVHYKVLGEGENNGGIFNKGGMHHIFLTVLDENGNGIDGAIVKDANGSALEVVTGDKGPGKAEIVMEWDPYKLFVAADPNGPTTSEVSNQMNTAFPHIPDIVGKLGDINNEYSVCPTPEIRCEPPFYSVHFSYEITFQRQ